MSKKILPDVNQLMLWAMKEKDISFRELASRLNMATNSVRNMLKSPGLQVHRLWGVCEVTQVNLFRILADESGLEYPEDKRVLELKKELELLRADMKNLQVERDTLKEAIRLLGK